MQILVTGKGGQLAWELEQTLPAGIELISLGVDQLDITNQAQVNQVLISCSPDIVINAAAYTAVDKAESEPELAYAVNQKGSEILATVCREIRAKLIHVSTDFVFDGQKTTPYQVDDLPNPLNIYGDSKLQGDKQIADILKGHAAIIRTAWVYSAHGHNFVKTMLKLMAEKPHLSVVSDQVGSPTWARGLALMIWSLIAKEQQQSFLIGENAHVLHWTDAGVASWYDFAIAIQQIAIEKGLLTEAIPIRPIPSSLYPTPAKRPSFSVLDKSLSEQVTGVNVQHWRVQLAAMLEQMQ